MSRHPAPRHLIHVGYPKAGSKFLQAWFESHPQVRYAPGGIAGFGSVLDMSRLSAHSYRGVVTSCEDLSSPSSGEGGYSFEDAGKPGGFPTRIREAQAEVCAALKATFPNALILIVTRGFREMAVSGYSQYVRAGGILHLAEMCRYFTERLGGDAANQFDFDYLVRLYTDAFGADNVVVLPYELLRDDRDRFLGVIEERLGLDHFEIELGRMNPSLTAEELYWYPVISRTVLAVVSRLGRGSARRAFNWYARFTFGNRLSPLVRLLSALYPDRKIAGTDLPEELLLSNAGKAAVLREHPLYREYGAEYLWDAGPDSAPPSRLQAGAARE